MMTLCTAGALALYGLGCILALPVFEYANHMRKDYAPRYIVLLAVATWPAFTLWHLVLNRKQ